MQNKQQWIISLIEDFIATCPDNRMGGAYGDEKMFDKPVVKFASGADGLYKKFKTPEICTEQHWLPIEAFTKFFPEEEGCFAEELTVVSWVLPQTSQTKESMFKEMTGTKYPSERWARVRFFGEPVNELLRRHVTDKLKEEGIKACAPVLHPEWCRLYENITRVISSKWSERHAAYTAGHGTFGLCDALITEAGKAHRVGSVIMKLKLPPNPRPYQGAYDYCLHFSKGICGACADNCMYDAVSRETGHDKQKCSDFMHGKTKAYVKEKFGFDGYGCGFCQVGVPCADGIPK